MDGGHFSGGRRPLIKRVSPFLQIQERRKNQELLLDRLNQLAAKTAPNASGPNASAPIAAPKPAIIGRGAAAVSVVSLNVIEPLTLAC